MPALKKAELVAGVVHMASPVRADQHGDPDSFLQTWCGTYAARKSGIRASTNTTIRLSPDDVLQPDICLRLLPENGGRCIPDDDGYLRGPPELVVEIAASSVSIDTREKLRAYRCAGVKEYIVWRTQDEAIDWWQLVEDDYLPLPPDADGILRSRCFPGLWLNAEALLRHDGAALLDTLNAGLTGGDKGD